MAFIERIVGPDEKLIGIMRVHWIYGAKGLMWFACFLVLGLFINNFIGGAIDKIDSLAHIDALILLSTYAFGVCALIGGVVLLFYVIMMATTELGLTSKRIIFKRGWLMVDVKESDLEEIKAAEVDNGVLGRILNYGYIVLDARFVDNTTLPAIGDPYRFIKASNEARSSLKEAPGMDFVDKDGRRKGKQSRTPHITEERYDALEHDAGAATAHMMDEADSDVDEHSSQKSAQAPHEEPTVFKQDTKKRKRALHDKIIRAFKRKSHT